MADIVLQASDSGAGEVRVDGVDLSGFVRGIGIDVETGKETRVVLEGGGRLKAALDSVEVGYRRIPSLSMQDYALLREAGDAAFEEGSEERERFALLLERLREVAAGPFPGDGGV